MQQPHEYSATSSKVSSSKTRSRTSDFIKKTIQGAREILASIHQPRNGPEGRVHIQTQPRIDFDVSFEEVDFVIDPDLINLCRELNAKIQYSSDSTLSGQPSFRSAISCVSFQDVSITTDSNGKLQINKTCSPTSTPVLTNYEEIPRTSTFIVFPSDSSQINPPSTCESTGAPSSKAFLILQSDHSNHPVTEKPGEIPAGTTFLILQSDGAFKRDTPDRFNQNVTVKLVNMNSENTHGNKNADESNFLRKQTRPFRIFTFDTLPKSSQIVSSKSFVSNDEPLYTKENKTVQKNNNVDNKTYRTKENHLESETDSTNRGKDNIGRETNKTYKGKDNGHSKRDNIHKYNRNNSVKNKNDALDKSGNKDFIIKNKPHVNITQLGTTKHPETSLLGKLNGETSRVEMVTVDPKFSSITKFDTVGSLQITQRPVRGRSKNVRSPEKKFGIYDYPMKTSDNSIGQEKIQPKETFETQEDPKEQKPEKHLGKSAPHRKRQFLCNSNADYLMHTSDTSMGKTQEKSQPQEIFETHKKRKEQKTEKHFGKSGSHWKSQFSSNADYLMHTSDTSISNTQEKSQPQEIFETQKERKEEKTEKHFGISGPHWKSQLQFNSNADYAMHTSDTSIGKPQDIFETKKERKEQKTEVHFGKIGPRRKSQFQFNSNADYAMHISDTSIGKTEEKIQPQEVFETQKERKEQKTISFGEIGPHRKSQFQFNSNIERKPTNLTVEKQVDSFGGGKSMFSVIEPSLSTMPNSSESFFSNDDDFCDTNVKKQENEMDKDFKIIQDNKKELDVIEEDIYSERGSEKNQRIEPTIDVDKTENKTFNNALENITLNNTIKVDELPKKSFHIEVNESDEINKTFSLSKRSSKSDATHKTISPPRNCRRLKCMTNSSRSSVSKPICEQSKQSGQSSSKNRNTKLTSTAKASQKLYYSQLKDRADEIKRRIRSKSERDNPDNIKSKIVSENVTLEVVHKDQRRDRIKANIEKRRASNKRQERKDFLSYTAEMKTAQSFVVITKESYARMKHNDKCILDTIKKPVKMNKEIAKEQETSIVRSKKRSKPILRSMCEKQRT